MIADERERRRALDPERSFIVQAPAGSGKTELLVRRYVRLLETVERPEEVLAITFTRKAAAEMRQRVLRRLPHAEEGANRLRIQTIDAFCAALTRQMPVLSRLGAQLDLVDDARKHYEEAAARALRDLSPPAAMLLAHLDNDLRAARSLLSAMLAKRDQWLRTTGNPPTRGALEAALQAEREQLLVRARALDPRACEDFAREVLTLEGEWRKRSAAAQALSGNEELRLALRALLGMPPAGYSDYQWEVLASMLELLPLAAAHLKVVFGERGEADFTEVAQGALQALGTPEAPTDLLLALDYRIRHILVDEFQDTSISQWQLLERLTAGWQPGDGRTLFLVGDPMQSIYRFREANVALFLRAQREGLPNVPLESIGLRTNFRSQAGLVGWFNEAFPRILPAKADEAAGAVPYTPAAPHPESEALPGAPVQWHPLADRRAEAERVVRLVNEAGKRAAILVRSRDALAEIVPALKREGIRFRAIEIERLGERPVVQDLCALTRALSHLGDRIAWLAILRAPWCGLTITDLHALAANARREPIFDLLFHLDGLSDDGRGRAARLRDTLGPAVAQRLRGTLRDAVEGAWLALGGPACVESETDLEDAEIYLDALEALEEAGDVDLEALEERLVGLYAAPDLAATDDDVQIMTIHRAKGLEFGTVIVPGLDRGPGRSDPPLFLWKEGLPAAGAPASALLLAPIRETGAEKDAAYEYLKERERAAEDLEAARLLYVAATRAETRLHLLGCVKCDDEGEPKPPPARSLLACAWTVAAGAFAGSQAAHSETSAAITPVQGLRRLCAGIPQPPSPLAWQGLTPASEEGGIEFSWAGESARHVGTVVHRWLQRMAQDELRDWDAQRVDILRPAFRLALQRRGVPRAELDAAVQQVAAALKNALADERGRWILGSHSDARTEYRLRVLGPQGVATRVLDRVFRTVGGERWVVDYKTSRHEGGDLEAFLDRERRRYAAQLNSYAQALPGARLGLYFPLLGGWRETKAGSD